MPISAAVGFLLAWAAVAHASGSEWVQALGALAAGVLIVGFVVPRWVLHKIVVTVEDAQADATTGGPLTVTVVANRTCKCLPVRPRGDPVLLPAGHQTALTLVPNLRGVIEAIDVRISTAAPLGLLWWSRRRRLVLPRWVTISPAPIADDHATTSAQVLDEGQVQAALAFQGELRGVRAYRHGDTPRQVHWPSTAHAGMLMIRENELRGGEPVRVVVDLPEDFELAEAAASRFMGRVTGLLDQHRIVILETSEGGSHVCSTVADRRTTGRRLARAEPNPWTDLGPASPYTSPGHRSSGTRSRR
ncbi:MAG: DUF58 domain-containing protein [Acidimicrobiales bacterium]